MAKIKLLIVLIILTIFMTATSYSESKNEKVVIEQKVNEQKVIEPSVNEYKVKDLKGESLSPATYHERQPTSVESVMGGLNPKQREEIKKTLENYKKSREEQDKYLRELEAEP